MTLATGTWSTTPDLNVVSRGVSGSGGTAILGLSPVSNFDNAARDIMAQIAEFFTSGTLTGAGATFTSTDAGATAGPILTLYRNSATPAVSDLLGKLLFQGEDSAGNTEDYAEIYAQILSATSTTEASNLVFRSKLGGATYTVTMSGPILYFGSGASITFNEGDVTLTHSSNALTLTGGDLLLGENRKTAQASTSGTTIDFSSIPANTRQITITFAGVSTNGSSVLLVQLGDSGGIEPSGYLGASTVVAGATPATANLTTGFGINSANAANVVHGAIILTLLDAAANTWVASGSFGLSNAAATIFSGGSKSLSATLDRVRITTVNGTDAFDAGSIGCVYS